MLDALVLNDMYSKIQKKLFYMIPERWSKIYLYASVIDQVNKLQTGEMFFYYFPKGLLKKNPVNVYEVPTKFNIDEAEYFALADELYGTIKQLRDKFERNNEKMWSSITISIENCKFNIEYKYENLLGSKYSSLDRHIVWKYKYLDLPIERFSKRERNMIEHYLFDEKFSNVELKKDVQSVYNQKINNIIDYNKEDFNFVEEENVNASKKKKVANDYITDSAEQIPQYMKNWQKQKIQYETEEKEFKSKNQILNL